MDLFHYFEVGDRVKNRTSGVEGSVVRPGHNPLIRWDSGIELPASYGTIKLIKDPFIKRIVLSTLDKINTYLSK